MARIGKAVRLRRQVTLIAITVVALGALVTSCGTQAADSTGTSGSTQVSESPSASHTAAPSVPPSPSLPPTPSAAATRSSAPTSQPTKTPSETKHALVPADAKTPASGACGKADGTTAIVTAAPDVPAPTCVSVTPQQELKVVNATDRAGSGRTVTVTFGGFEPRTVPAGQSTTFAEPFGHYLQPGVHFLTITGFSGHAEVWLH